MGYRFLIVSRSLTPEVGSIISAASKYKEINVDSYDVISPETDLSAYDVVYWRSASITKNFLNNTGRNTLLRSLPATVTVLNSALITTPSFVYKSVQQAHFKAHVSNLKGIVTHMFSSYEELLMQVESGALQFPFIAKPNHGSQGVGVELISNTEQLKLLQNISSLVFQNFIRNNGDFRVIVVGGVVVDVIRRRPSEHSTKTYLNNISQGGIAEPVTEKLMRDSLINFGEIVAAVFGYEVCGIDCIQSADSGDIYFLEINSVPQWELFRPALRADVGDEVVKLMISNAKRKHGTHVPSAVRSFYDEHIDCLTTAKRFHYLSRMHFFFPEQKQYADQLMRIRSDWLPNASTLIHKLTAIPVSLPEEKSNGGRSYRELYYKRHHKIYLYNAVFFKLLFLETIYNESTVEILARVNHDDVSFVTKELCNDPCSFLALSTHAVNFIYHSNRLFWNNTFDPRFVYDLKNVTHTLQVHEYVDSLIYAYTHAIIGATNFYSKDIDTHRIVYEEMLDVLDELILEHYLDVSLDQKFEVLTCAKLLKKEMKCYSLIEQEANVSLSRLGDFYVDTIGNAVAERSKFKRSFGKSEHRNVLGIYALS